MKLAACVALVAILIPSAALAQPNDLIGVARAVGIAEGALSARALEAELETRSGRLVYAVEVVRNGSLHEAQVDARTGKLLATDKRRLESLWRSWFDAARLTPSGLPLGRMLAALEAETGGRVQEVDFDSKGGRTWYEVEIATAAGVADILLDPAAGRRLPEEADD